MGQPNKGISWSVNLYSCILYSNLCVSLGRRTDYNTSEATFTHFKQSYQTSAGIRKQPYLQQASERANLQCTPTNKHYQH